MNQWLDCLSVIIEDVIIWVTVSIQAKNITQLSYVILCEVNNHPLNRSALMPCTSLAGFLSVKEKLYLICSQHQIPEWSGLRLNYMKKLHDTNLKSKAFLNKYYISTGQDFPCPYHLYTFQFRSSLGRKNRSTFPRCYLI